ncbi:MAG: HAD-IB family phosphatase [Oscillospiraceae bacterium]|jgi:HAD superfamily phosphoserine phosphatase-like hydrolase|nr:HAD-IB family phosphatase [Oscillospiraceae bacterium]
MNVYDFDKTIYRGDSTLDFYFFCLKRNPAVLLKLPSQLVGGVKYLAGMHGKTEFKQAFYSFLKILPDTKKCVSDFWHSHERKLEQWYINQMSGEDVIISASPDFLLRPLCERLGVTLIASIVDSETGRCEGRNCYGEEKLLRFRELYKDTAIDKFYSDSHSDYPLAKIARENYIVREGKILEWEQ